MGWKKTAKKAGRAVGKRTLKAAGWAVQSAPEPKQKAKPPAKANIATIPVKRILTMS